MPGTPLHALDLPRKLLLTAVLAVLAAGFAAGEGCVFHQLALPLSPSPPREGVGGGGGKPSSILDAITFTFHGNRARTRLKEKALGSMRRFFSAFEDATVLSAEEQADLDRVLAWNDAGAPEGEFLRAEQGRTPIFVILERRGCLSCHASGAAAIGNKKDSPLTTYAGVARFTSPDQGLDAARLLLLTHVHLLGLAVIFLITGAAVGATLWPVWLRGTLMAAGPLGVLATVGGWWAVRYGGAPWAPLVFLGGILMVAGFGLSVLAALYDLWLRGN
ncbi:MAG: hypothetical protein ABSE73_23995 [Planctomycetota bacterium]